jgi:hypothetical protein
MFNLFFSKKSLHYSINYYHFTIDILRPLYNYLEINNLKEDDVIIYCDFINNYNNILNVLSLKYRPFKEAPLNSIEICKYKYSSYKSLINRFNVFNNCINDFPKIVFIKRSRNRNIINEDECILKIREKFSDKYNIIEVKFEEMKYLDQIAIMNNCKLLIGAHGAGITNCLFMNENTHVIELFPESFYVDCYKRICKEKSLIYNYIHGIDIIKPNISLLEFKKLDWKDEKNKSIIAKLRDTIYKVNSNELIELILKIF